MIYVVLAITYLSKWNSAFDECADKINKCFNSDVCIFELPADQYLNLITVGGFLITILGTYIAWIDSVGKGRAKLKEEIIELKK